MKIPGSTYVASLFRWEKRLLLRFVVTSLGRSATQVGVLLLIREFLTGALDETDAGLGGAVAASLGSEAVLWTVAGLLFLTYVASSLFNYDNKVTQQRIVKVLELGLMDRLIRHMLTLSVSFFDRQSRGDIIQAVRTDVSQMRIVVTSLANIFLESVIALGLLIAALAISPMLTLWALVLLPLAAFPMVLIAKRTLARSYEVRKRGYVLFDVILQVVSGIRIIKAYRGEDAEAQGSLQKARRYLDEMIEIVRVRSLSQVVLESLAGLGIVVVIVVGGVQVMRGTLDWPSLLAFVLAVRALHGPLNNINTHLVQAQSFGASVSRITELLETEAEVMDLPGALPLDCPPEVIRLEDVSFSYGDELVLDSITFEVQAGETIGIAGPSGSGKSTLLNLLVRFYDPTEGRVLFDGHDLREYRLRDVYGLVGIVTQDPFLFDTTLRQNINCGRPAATQQEVEDAARAAYIHDEILALPEGYETVVGVGGRGLSGGQRQRVNIARAILKNAPIMLLDEATSALDSVAEAEVQRAIDSLVGGRTTFIIAHRLSTLRDADRILILDRGRIEGFGTHEGLMETCSLYRKMWSTQQLEPAISK